jgi:hypothetical protein
MEFACRCFVEGKMAGGVVESFAAASMEGQKSRGGGMQIPASSSVLDGQDEYLL